MISRLTKQALKMPCRHNLINAQKFSINNNDNNDKMARGKVYPLRHRQFHKNMFGNLLAYNFQDNNKRRFNSRNYPSFIETDNNRDKDLLGQSAVQQSKNDWHVNIQSKIVSKIINFAKGRSESEDLPRLLQQTKQQINQKLKSAQFQQYLADASQLHSPQESLLYAINSICWKIKGEGIELQDLENYRAIERHCNQFFQAFPDAKKQLILTAQKICAQVEAYQALIESELKQKQQRQKLQKDTENNEEEKNQQSKDSSNQKSKSEGKAEYTKTLANLKVSILDLSTILNNLVHIPQELHPQIYELTVYKIRDLNNFSLATFMIDSVVNRRELTRNFLRNFHLAISQNTFRSSYRYCFLCFVDFYMNRAYLPLYPLPEDGRRSYFYSQFTYQFNILQKYVKLMAMQYEVGIKCATRFLFDVFGRKIYQLDTFLAGDVFQMQQIIKLYNILSRSWSLGLTIAKNGRFKEFQVNKSNLSQAKQFVLNFMKNLEPRYIYSTDQKVDNEVNQQILRRLYYLSNEILKFQKQFILQISPLLQISHKKGSKYKINQNMLFGKANKIIDELIVQLKLKENASAIVLNSKNEADRKVKQVAYKLLNMLQQNHQDFELNSGELSEFLAALHTEFMKTDPSNINNWNIDQWKFLYQTCFLLNKIQPTQEDSSVNTKLLKIYERFCEPYFRSNQTNTEQNMVKRAKLYQEYILRIARFVRNHIKTNPETGKMISNFVNNNFIYTAKSIVKQGLFDILLLFNSLPNINPEIYAYLYANLSTFIVYIKSTQRFYLNIGKNQRYTPYYEMILNEALDNYESLKNVRNKNRLHLLKLLANIFWDKLPMVKIAKLLIILGNSKMINDELAQLVKKVKFIPKDFENLNLNILASFRLRNKNLAAILDHANISPDAQIENDDNLLLSDSKTSDQLQKMFKSEQLYELAFENPSFTNDHLIPPPQGSDQRTKMIYACLKISHKIRSQRDFSLSALLNQFKESDNENRFGRKEMRTQQVDLSEQMSYIKNNNLLKSNKLNQFKLGDTSSSGHYEMVECWNSSEQFANLNQIPGYNNAFSQSDPYEEVMLVLIGNYGLIKKLVKNQRSSTEILKIIRDLKLDQYSKGSLMCISEYKKLDEIYIFCSKPTNIKLHTIYAYILSQMGLNVCIYQQKNSSIQQVRELFVEAFIKDKNETIKESLDSVPT